MKKKVLIEIEETITETRVARQGNIHCPACGSLISLSRPHTGDRQFNAPRIETIFIKPENVKLLDPAKE